LIAEFKAGESKAFDELINRYSVKLYQTAYGLISDHHDAEEVVQDAFVRAHRALHKFRGDAKFETWMHRIVTNLARNKYHWNRRRGAGVNISLHQTSNQHDADNDEHEVLIPDKSLGPDVMMANYELEDSVMTGFNKLPVKLKEVMLLRHVNEMPYEKIAEVLKCKVGTVKSRIARGREVLRKILSEKRAGRKP
jgi:RNA polymerase sigma-70 factor (ECF subfamily)